MAVKLKNGVIDIDKIQIDNAIVTEYLAGLPESRRDEAIIKAIGIGVLAEIKGEIAQFLNETEGELGKHLASLKTLYELRELRFKETSGKGEKAESLYSVDEVIPEPLGDAAVYQAPGTFSIVLALLD